MTPRLSHRFLHRSLQLTLCAALGLASALSQAQTYPSRPIRLVVTFPPGGAPDILARLFSEKAQLGQPLVVDNKPGAGGNIGADIVAKSPGDGYTLVMGTVGTHAINGALYDKMPYDMVKNFSPISLLASAPNLLVVHNDLPVRSVPELIAYMKANPNKLSFGSPGVGTSVHVSGELFKSMTGTSMTHTVQGPPVRHSRPDRWQHTGDVRQHAVGVADGARRQDPGAGADHRAPLGGSTRCADGRRVRPGIRGHHLVCPVRAGRNAQAGRGSPERRTGTGIPSSRCARPSEDPGP